MLQESRSVSVLQGPRDVCDSITSDVLVLQEHKMCLRFKNKMCVCASRTKRCVCVSRTRDVFVFQEQEVWLCFKSQEMCLCFKSKRCVCVS